MDSVSPDIALVEFHDARLRQLCVYMGGGVELVFRQVVVFLPVRAEEFQVWSYEADLHLVDVTKLEVLGLLNERDYIMDDEIRLGSGSRISPEKLLQGVASDNLRLSFFSGSIISIQYKDAELRLGRALKCMEIWSGPLR